MLVIHLEEVWAEDVYVRITSAGGATSAERELYGKIIRYSAEELRAMDFSEELKHLAKMPDSSINTSKIPE